MKAYNDIVRLDIVDTYADLSAKTLKMFSILPQKVDADFYFKVDDDVAINIDAMESYLQSRRAQGNIYMVSKHSCGFLCQAVCNISMSGHYYLEAALAATIISGGGSSCQVAARIGSCHPHTSWRADASRCT